MLPLSNLSSTASNGFSTLFANNPNNKEKSLGISSSLNSIYSSSGDEYRQCRRLRNTAIANQQKQTHNQYLSPDDDSSSFHQTRTEQSPQRVSRFWRTVRALQLGVRNRRQTGQYNQQINDSGFHPRRTTVGTSLRTIEEDENVFKRADLEVAEPVLHELPATMPVVPQPIFISLSNNDQDDDQDTVPVTGQTLCKTFLFQNIGYSCISL